MFFGTTESALDLHLDGTIGTFNISQASTDKKSIEVRYILTHVSLDEKSATDQRLLDKLAPVREVFNLNELDFDELMQRDIDDSRVSLELIPYLLDRNNTGLIKLFPPIVAVALPLSPMSRKPSKRYPTISKSIAEFSAGQPSYTKETVLCGSVGQEVFRFEQVLQGDRRFKADSAKLAISTQNCALAIVDGQHRAMALLALYRNLKGGWNQAERQPYKHYYDVWPESIIKQFDTSGLQLPVMICTFPDLDEGYPGDIDVVRAARRIFLTLNKNARKVSESRNKLLDDQDLASECLRETLAMIKEADKRSTTSLRIFNIELDQQKERTIITNPIAMTGVPHLYYICERILFLSDRISGLASKSIRMGARKDASCAIDRLKLKNELSEQEQKETRRDNYTDKVATIIESRWRETFGSILVKLLDELYPFRAHQMAVLNSHVWLSKQPGTAALTSMLFDGQGTAKTFEDFELGLKQLIEHAPGEWSAPEIHSTKTVIADMNDQRDAVIATMKKDRASIYFNSLKGCDFKAAMTTTEHNIAKSTQIVDHIIERVCSTVAFQAALVLTFIDALEGTKVDIMDKTLLDEYIQQLNSFFTPKDEKRLTRLCDTLSGKVVINDGNINILHQHSTSFKEIVHPTSEMQPDEWTRYRYLIIELWKPSHPELKSSLAKEREKLRKEIIEQQINRSEKIKQSELGRLDLSEEEKEEARVLACERCEEWFARF